MQDRVSILAVCSACFVVWLFLCKLQVLIHKLISDARPNELLSAHLKLPLLLKDKSFCVFEGKKKGESSNYLSVWFGESTHSKWHG